MPGHQDWDSGFPSVSAGETIRGRDRLSNIEVAASIKEEHTTDKMELVLVAIPVYSLSLSWEGQQQC